MCAVCTLVFAVRCLAICGLACPRRWSLFVLCCVVDHVCYVLLFAVCCVLFFFVACCALCVVSRVLTAIVRCVGSVAWFACCAVRGSCCSVFARCCLLLGGCCLLRVVRCFVLFVVRCSLFDVCCLLFAGSC